MSSNGAAVSSLGPLGDQMLAAVDAPGFAPVALGVALGAGALHALAPGHGKSLAAAYLVGAHGRRRDALLLGGTVAAMHTASVVAVALGWMMLSSGAAPDLGPLSQVLQLAAGGLIVAAGVVLVRRRRHDHDDHHHDRRRDHDDQPVPSGGRPGLVLLGASGGLLPSPAAFLLLLTGLFSGRTWLALALVVVFGLGMAVVLSGVGLVTVTGRDLLVRAAAVRPALQRAARVGPAFAAYGVLAAGCALTAAGVLGWPRS